MDHLFDTGRVVALVDTTIPNGAFPTIIFVHCPPFPLTDFVPNDQAAGKLSPAYQRRYYTHFKLQIQGIGQPEDQF